MRRIAAGLAWVGLAASTPFAWARGDDPPRLTPALTGPVADPPTESPPKAVVPPEAKPSAHPGQVLVLPGITTPRPAPRTIRPVEGLNGLPPLLEPSTLSATPPATARDTFRPFGGNDPFAPTGRPTGRPPITLESVPTEDDLTPPIETPSPPTPGAELRNPPRGALPPRRPQGLFGRLFPTPGTADRRGAAGDDSVRVEPRDDPAADAALKRRIERQIHDKFGSKLRSFEVRVNGRDVAVRARAARFWQRRALRGGLEALPALSGTRAAVEVVD